MSLPLAPVNRMNLMISRPRLLITILPLPPIILNGIRPGEDPRVSEVTSARYLPLKIELGHALLPSLFRPPARKLLRQKKPRKTHPVSGGRYRLGRSSGTHEHPSSVVSRLNGETSVNGGLGLPLYVRF